MTEPPHAPLLATCPSCGSAISRGALSCSCCGGVIAVESFLTQFRHEARRQAARLGEYLGNRDVLLWVLAMFPVLILPPLLVLLVSFRPFTNGRASTDRGRNNFDFLLPAVAICNIVLSALFWRWLSEMSMFGLSAGLLHKWIGIGVPSSSLNKI